MLISIVTPTYNSGKYIEETISSVLMQSYRKWEWFIVDGGSSDNTIEIINNYKKKDSRINLIISESDSGPAEARCNGIKASNGLYIAFLDSDDLWHPNKLMYQIDFMIKNEISFSYTLCRELQKDEENVSIILPTSNSFNYNEYLRKRGIYAFTVMVKVFIV